VVVKDPKLAGILRASVARKPAPHHFLNAPELS
jgi:hypothetical protein